MGRWIRCGVLVTSLSFGLAAQDMPYPVGYTYVAMAESGGPSVTATSVVNTNCTAGHTVPNVAVNLYNPGRTRSAYAYNYAQYCYAQATAYLPLCPATGCEDGTFEADNEGTTEYCPIAAAYVAAVAASAQQTVRPYVFLDSASWSPSSVRFQGDQSTFYVQAKKSPLCDAGAASLGASMGSVPPANIRFSISPSQNEPQACTFSEGICRSSWTLTTLATNEQTGAVSGHGHLMGNTGTCDNRDVLKSGGNLQVVRP